MRDLAKTRRQRLARGEMRPHEGPVVIGLPRIKRVSKIPPTSKGSTDVMVLDVNGGPFVHFVYFATPLSDCTGASRWEKMDHKGCIHL